MHPSFLDSSLVALFFFQAEDGIRAGHVTGVQTCALPISASACPVGEGSAQGGGLHLLRGALGVVPRGRAVHDAAAGPLRSEERRVGKEWRSRTTLSDETTQTSPKITRAGSRSVLTLDSMT